MDVTVQWVRTSWTKQSRGGAAAARRNACPVGFGLPPGAVFHEVRMDEAASYAPVEVSSDVVPEMRRSEYGTGLSLAEDDGRLRVQAAGATFFMRRRRQHPPAVRLVRGQWVRWVINYRYLQKLSGGQWMYRLETFNVAYGDCEGSVFLGEPDLFVDQRRIFG